MILTPESTQPYNLEVANAKERTAQIIVRLAPEEKESFERAAEIAGQNLSDWVRTRLRQIAVNELSSAGETPLFMPPTKVKGRKI
jgi:sugar (pentulose or hexulose) kinase